MTRAIEWFARNPVAANLLMFIILFGGVVLAPTIRQEVFPEFSTDQITVSVPYLGAAPEEVEEGICVRIEEQIQGITGIKKITSTAAEGIGTVNIELIEGADVGDVLDEVKNRVDAIDTFPEEIESPTIQEVLVRRQVISVAVSGPADESSLKTLGEDLRDQISALPGITQVELTNARPYEVSIEVSEEALRRYGLRFQDVADAVRQTSLDLPGGSIRSDAGEILLRTKGQVYRGEEFERIPVISRRDGTRIPLGEIATVVDGFEQTDQRARFDGESAVLIQVFRVGDQSALEIADAVKAFVEDARNLVPDGIELTTWQDDSEVLRSRLDLLLRNGRSGLILVLLILALFLRLRLAFWVSLGIPISFFGALLLMPGLDVSVNLISLFAFIVVLGIVVDDAIVVGENIYAHYEQGKSKIKAAVDGAQEMAVPVVFAILTTVVAFSPLLAVPGATGKIFRVIPLVVIPTLVFSLIESIWILPAHLSHLRHEKEKKPGSFARLCGGVRRILDLGLTALIENVYGPSVRFALRWRYATVAFGLATLMFVVGLIGGGWLKFSFFPEVEADNLIARITMPLGTPVEVTEAAVRRIEAAALILRDEVDAERGEDAPSIFRHMLASIGEQPSLAQRQGPRLGSSSGSGGHLAEINIELLSAEQRNQSSTELAERWRELSGVIPDATELTFTSSLFTAGNPINVQLTGPDVNQLRQAAEELKQGLQRYAGVYDISDSFRAGKKEIRLQIQPEAEILGLSQRDLARQVRQAFYGEEAQRIQRGRDDVRVMVRYPEAQRRSLATLEDMRIRTAGGGEVPFSEVAQAEIGRGYSSITRVDRRRAINVTAKVDLSQANANEVIASLLANELPELLSRYPAILYSLEGEQREQQDTLRALGRGFLLAMFVIFALMAVPLKSYVQPLIIMSAIPFGFVGAVWGHLIMGQDLTILSGFGMVALTGVVVNDSLILVDYINRKRSSGAPILSVVQRSGQARFRAILLTSLTTFGGLTPLLLEKSLQAQFLIPMAISLAYGVMFSTFVTLVLVPSLYMIVEDLKGAWYRFRGTEPAELEQEAASA